ncbi:hypothetical protein CO172_02970 [Candidatus Uhrbacteria bacterium CG_4_9_14_3_um_filter_36_7]|uniref:Phospholipase C/D domain-containing protein n=1 Tax=Candidatus Uhrbacteria bacterium CG_4_9_14_3_um_filter_36_7 TaxID=1975033 RepID=A0A2M7XH03_9BACT|nr:MAG: hypothetical protein CO172_02970 [Candidatus Uhrbacteria bacterium CG_4_9_14_3_um_filter_36_7]
MAMEATHVLFAKNLKPRLNVQNEPAFFAGSIYPDSRYLTGLPRQKTHGLKRLQNPFSLDLSDFEKGWATHILYDQISGTYLREIISGNPDTSNQALITMTAMKLLEDQASYKKIIDPNIIFQTMEIPKCPCKESKEKLEMYYHLNEQLYYTSPNIEAYQYFFEKLMPSKTYVDQVIDEANQISKNSRLKLEVLQIYNQVINNPLLI